MSIVVTCRFNDQMSQLLVVANSSKLIALLTFYFLRTRINITVEIIIKDITPMVIFK